MRLAATRQDDQLAAMPSAFLAHVNDSAPWQPIRPICGARSTYPPCVSIGWLIPLPRTC